MTTRKPQPSIPCIRCGQLRSYTRKSTTLCQDCRYVMSENERKAWTTAA